MGGGGGGRGLWGRALFSPTQTVPFAQLWDIHFGWRRQYLLFFFNQSFPKSAWKRFFEQISARGSESSAIKVF